jgi:hypothetical protein
MLLSNKIKIKIKQPNIKYYNNIGYNVKYNDEIEIPTEQLPPFSREKVKVKCDICGKEKEIRYFVYYKNYKKYGIYTCSQKCCQEKINKTNNEKYGCNRPIQNVNIRKKLEEKCIEKYGVEVSSKNKDISNKSRDKRLQNLLDKYKNLNINYIKEHIANFNCDNGKDHTFNIDFGLLGNRIKRNTIICTECNPLNSYSKSGREIKFQNFIEEIYKDKLILNNNNIIGKELDVFLPKLKLAFEFNGLYWHNELYKPNNYHQEKTELAEKHGIKLIHIYEDDWIYKQDIVKSRILNLLGKSDKIYARKCNIKEINNPTLIRNFLEKNHLQGFATSKIKIGLFYNDELVSLMTFGNKRKPMGQKSSEGTYEMLRFCNKLNTNIVGGASRLFKYFIDQYIPKEVISYADRSWSQGNLYEKLGFELVHKTKPNYYYVVDGVRKYRFGFRKDRLIKEGSDPNKTEKDIMIEKNIYRIYDSGHLKYKYMVC